MSRRKAKTSLKREVFGVIVLIISFPTVYWLVTDSWDILDWVLAGFR